jgi:proteic killer suppression protein
MIQSITHKGLRLLFERNDASKLPAEFVPKIRRLLDRLDALAGIEDVMSLGMGIPRLSGDRKEFWSVKISLNYRIIFRFEDGHVYEVDYLDYH